MTLSGEVDLGLDDVDLARRAEDLAHRAWIDLTWLFGYLVREVGDVETFLTTVGSVGLPLDGDVEPDYIDLQRLVAVGLEQFDTDLLDEVASWGASCLLTLSRPWPGTLTPESTLTLVRALRDLLGAWARAPFLLDCWYDSDHSAAYAEMWTVPGKALLLSTAGHRVEETYWSVFTNGWHRLL